ncbi:MAG: hypothetical protein HC822_23515, partial [Oscillochloris sp.]|nr:hypothetical protein [Oscillochloris sp.]
MTVAPSTSASGQSLADEVWQLMTAQGALFAINAPIRQSIENLAAYFAGVQKRPADAVAADITAALSADPRFTREDRNGTVIFMTSRLGGEIASPEVDTHSFKQRLHDPEKPLPIDDISVVVSTSRPAITTVEPVFISDYWQIQAGLAIAAAEAADVAPPEAAPVPVETTPSPVPMPEVESVTPMAEEPVVV